MSATHLVPPDLPFVDGTFGKSLYDFRGRAVRCSRLLEGWLVASVLQVRLDLIKRCGQTPWLGEAYSQADTTVATTTAARATLVARLERLPSISRLRRSPPATQIAADGTMTTIIVTATRSPPARVANSAGRNVVMAPSAKIQAFGLISWNAAAWSRPRGRPTTPRWRALAPAIW